MENIETLEQIAALDENGVAIDVNVIAKDAEIELNNNDCIKMDEKVVKSQENLTEKLQPMAESAKDDEKCAEPNESSMNMDNGQEGSIDNKSTEGESKVEQTSDSDTANTKSDSSDSASVTTSESANETQNGTESSDSSDASECGAEKTEKSVDSNEQLHNGQNTMEDTVTSASSDAQSDAKPTGEPSEKSNDVSPKKSSKQSPKKKSSNKKRKNQRSQKKEIDYSSFVNYTLSVTQRQRRYSLSVTRGRTVPIPDDDCEIFCTNIPINVLEPELLPLFERFGKIWELRLMMSLRNPKRNAGFAFVRYTSSEAAQQATEKLNNYEILPGKHLAIRLSQPNLSLFVGNIHRGLTRDQIHDKISSKTNGLVKTFVKSSVYEDTKNCGFCFLEYDCHSAAMKAKRLLNSGNVWGRQLYVDWAQRRKQFDNGEQNESKTLFINYLQNNTTEQQIIDTLSSFGTIDKVTKIKDYAFVLFEEHQAAIDALNGADKTKFGDEVEISLAMPKTSKSRPSFGYRRPRQYGRNNLYNRFKPSFGSSNRFYMRKQVKATDRNQEAASTVVEQTVIPLVVTSPPVAIEQPN